MLSRPTHKPSRCCESVVYLYIKERLRFCRFTVTVGSKIGIRISRYSISGILYRVSDIKFYVGFQVCSHNLLFWLCFSFVYTEQNALIRSLSVDLAVKFGQ